MELTLTANNPISAVCLDDEILGRKKLQRSDCLHCSIRPKMLFASLDIEKMSSWFWPINHMVCEARTRLYHQGQPPQSIFSIRRGFIKLTQLNVDGEEKIVRLLGPGACLGLEALTQQGYHQTAEALTEIDYCTIPIKIVFELEKKQPVIYGALIEQWQQQLSDADQWLSQFFSGTIKQRLCRFLLMQHQLQQMPNEQLLLISNQDIASVLATSDETISRCLSGLRSSGVLKKVEKRIYTLDLAAAKTLAGS